MKFRVLFVFVFVISLSNSFAQVNWTSDGTGYTIFKNDEIVKVDVKTSKESIVINKNVLIPAGENKPLQVQSFDYSFDNSKILLFANTAKDWRRNTRGDYWLFDRSAKKLTQLGKGRPVSSLMFAKFSPDGRKVASNSLPAFPM